MAKPLKNSKQIRECIILQKKTNSLIMMWEWGKNHH